VNLTMLVPISTGILSPSNLLKTEGKVFFSC
jgi:hypothetical protein